MRIITILFLINTLILHGQGIINNGGNIVVNNSPYIVINGNGNWTNNGGTLTQGTGTVSFGGNINQTIQGTSSSNFYNLTINKSGGDALLAVDISVDNNLTMSSGDFDLQNSTIDLGNNGTIISETETNRIKVGDPSSNIGTITSTKTINNVSNFNPANLGVKITTNQNLGTITIVRGHLIQTGSYNGTTSFSIARYYEIPNIGKLDAAENLIMHYWDAELNGLTESQLEGFHWVTEGSSSSWWTSLDGTEDTGNNIFTTASSPYDSYFTTSTWYGFTWSNKFTLGSKETPLPVIISNFNVNCNTTGTKIDWITQSEINNNYFTIEKSSDSYNFINIAEIKGLENSNSIANYSYTDNNYSGLTYYRLSQTDLDGTTIFFKIISANCENLIKDSDEITLYPNPAKNYTRINIKGKHNYNKIIICDIVGKHIEEKTITNEDRTILLDTSKLSKGVYNIILKSNQQNTIKQLIVTD